MNVEEFTGSILKLPKSEVTNLSDYQVIMGFAGFGNVGFLTLSHMIETMELESFAFWGNSSWFYKNNIESTLTAYKHEASKTIIITTRIPLFVSSMAKQIWDSLVQDVFSWNCRRYIIIGGLREDTRQIGSSDWAAFVPTKQWSELFGHKRDFADKLSMIGPLSTMLTLGTTSNIPVLGLLAYCNNNEDPDASLYAVTMLQEIAGIEIPSHGKLMTFDFSFLSLPREDLDEYLESDGTDDFDSFDVEDLI